MSVGDTTLQLNSKDSDKYREQLRRRVRSHTQVRIVSIFWIRTEWIRSQHYSGLQKKEIETPWCMEVAIVLKFRLACADIDELSNRNCFPTLYGQFRKR